MSEDAEISERERGRAVRINYTNWRKETGDRTIVPVRIFFDSNQWHPEPQWLLEAIDLEKGASRTFALKDIHRWSML